jgi:trk system potassium uptake protein TrkA
MKIIIAGAGELGFHLARLLYNDSQDITVVDSDAEALAFSSEHIDVMTLRGDASLPSVLQQAEVAKAELVLAVTGSESRNILIGSMASQLGASRVVVRVSEPELLSGAISLQRLGIDRAFSPQLLAVNQIEALIRHPGLTEIHDFNGGSLRLVVCDIPTDSHIAGRTIIEAARQRPSVAFHVVAILRAGETIVPRGGQQINAGDRVYFMIRKTDTRALLELAGIQRKPIRRIMILGSGLIARRVASHLLNEHQVKLIERSRDKCLELADALPDATIIHGDSRHVQFLEDEELSEMDAFVAVTDDFETNIMSSLIAKSHGVNKTISLAEHMDYRQLTLTIGIDALVNHKLLAASQVYRFCREGEIVDLSGFLNLDAQMLEFKLTGNPPATEADIRDLGLPATVVIAGVIRNGSPLLVFGDFRLKEKDRVIIFSSVDTIHTVNELFR